MELVVQFPARGSTLVLLCLFPVVLWLWHFLYSVGPNPVSSLYSVYALCFVSRALMAGAASQAGDADSSRAAGLTSGLKGSVNVRRGALLLVPQWYCASVLLYFAYVLLVEQDKSSDIEQQPPFGDRKISNIQPQNRGGGGVTKPTGLRYQFFPELVVIFPVYAIRTSLSTFSILLVFSKKSYFS